MLVPSHYRHNEIVALDRAYINYAKFEELTERGVVYVTKMKKNLSYEVLVDYMYQNPQGMMEFREQVVVFRKDGINHIARIITYVDFKKGSKHSVNHVFLSPTSIINFTSKKQSYDDTRRSSRDNELLQRAQSDL